MAGECTTESSARVPRSCQRVYGARPARVRSDYQRVRSVRLPVPRSKPPLEPPPDAVLELK